MSLLDDSTNLSLLGNIGLFYQIKPNLAVDLSACILGSSDTFLLNLDIRYSFVS
jgi:hypothetical protein